MKVRYFLLIKCVVLSVIAPVELQAMKSPADINKFYWDLIVERIQNRDLKGAQDALRQGLKRRFDVHYQGEQESPLLTIVAAYDNVDLVKDLLAAGAHPSFKDTSGQTPLHKATNPAIIKELVKAGADVNARDEDGNTPLMEAASGMKTAAVQTLLTTPGIDIMVKNNEDKTALDVVKEDQYISEKDKQEMLKILSPYYTTLRGLGLDYIRKHRDKFTDEQIKKLPFELQEALPQQQ